MLCEVELLEKELKILELRFPEETLKEHFTKKSIYLIGPCRRIEKYNPATTRTFEL